MVTIRRVYFYLVAYVSLLVLAGGLSGLGRTLIRAASATLATPVLPGAGLRSDVALYGAMTAVGLPFWLLHWLATNRLAGREAAERAAALRRLYLYAVLGAMILTVGIATQSLLKSAFQFAIPGAGRPTTDQLLSSLPALLVGAAFWTYHRRVVLLDRQAAGEQGASATLRRWYAYGVAFVALLLLLSNGAHLLRLAWETIAAAATGTLARTGAAGAAGSAATVLVALGLWLTHWPLWAVQGTRPRVAAPFGARASTGGQGAGAPPGGRDGE
jgi:hypothetical protein